MTVTRLQPEGDRFEEFWHVWKVLGRNIKRAICEDMFAEITSSQGFDTVCEVAGQRKKRHWQDSAERIVAGARAYMNLNMETERRFIVTPEVFLNQGRWRDFD